MHNYLGKFGLELVRTGHVVLKGKRLKDMKLAIKDAFGSEANFVTKTTVLVVFDIRAILNLAMLMTKNHPPLQLCLAPSKKAARNHPMFQNPIPSKLTRAILAAFIFIAAVLPSYAQQSGAFTYVSTGSAIIITAYTGAGGAVTIPSSISSLPVTIIGTNAFQGKTTITSVTIPNSVTSIGFAAFRDCIGLTSVTIGSGVTSIGNEAFMYCRGLTSVTIPNSVTSIGQLAFYQCASLTSVTIPNSVTSIGEAAFYSCTGLTNLTIGSGVTSIGNATFYGCSGLTSLTIGSGVTSIGYLALGNCTGLTTIIIPSSVTNIGSSAFSGCSSLTILTIPSSVSSISGNAFQYCYNLTSVHFQGNAPSADPAAFADTYPTIYYYAGKTGWGSTYAGRPTVQVGASISSQPVSVTALQGTSASFTVTASGATSYQWQKNSVNIPLATTATLTLKNVQSTDATNYRVIVYNPAGNLTSNTATLTVLPDSDLDGLSDAAEAGYGTNPNNADSDGDGLSDRAEIQVYLSNALLKDSDADGFEDGFEVSTGFNPAQSSSSPDSVSAIDNAVRFRFNAGLGLSYKIEESTDLQTWTTLESPIVGAGAEVTRYYPVVGHPKRYFRVKRNL